MTSAIALNSQRLDAVLGDEGGDLLVEIEELGEEVGRLGCESASANATGWRDSASIQPPVMVTDALRNEPLTGMPSKTRLSHSVIEEIKHRLLPP